MSIRRKPAVVCHKAALESHVFPPNSLEAVEACLAANMPYIEIDVVALKSSDYLLVHNDTLDEETDGHGPTGALSPMSARQLHIQHKGLVTQFSVPLLRDVVKAFVDCGGESQLQIDFKNVVPFANDEPLERLLNIIEPLGQRVIVSSIADWQIRRLRRLAPWLTTGFDVQLYLDWVDDPSRRDPRTFPRNRGAYGYMDDHPLATQTHWSAAEYLRDRAQTIIDLAPNASVFYIRHNLLAHSLANGFNWAKALHAAGIELDAWTVDTTDAQAMESAVHLFEAGLDRVTTNTPLAMAQVLG